METKRKLIIVGASAFAEVAYEYFTHDSPYDVHAFSVDKKFIKQDSLFGKPILPLEELSKLCPSTDYDVFVALTYGKLNRERHRLFDFLRQHGYQMATYISSQAFVWPNVKVGENCFIFENNVVQPFVTIGDNVILWSGNHIGHHSKIADHVFISSHVVISGYVEIGHHCFLGVNSAIANNLKIAHDTWVSPNVTLLKDTNPGELYGAISDKPAQVSTYKFFKVENPS